MASLSLSHCRVIGHMRSRSSEGLRVRTPLSHCREDEVEWGEDTKCEGEDGFVGFIMSSLCHCVHKAEDKGEGRSEGGKTGSGLAMDGTYDVDGLAQLAMWGHVSSVAWLWCEPIK